MPQDKPKVSLLDALESATEADLDAVIEQVKDARRRLAALQHLERLLDLKLHGKKPGTAKGGGRKGTLTMSQREKAAEYLVHAGSAKPAIVAAQCGIPTGSITAVLRHEWFDVSSEGVSLTAAGKRAVA